VGVSRCGDNTEHWRRWRRRAEAPAYVRWNFFTDLYTLKVCQHHTGSGTENYNERRKNAEVVPELAMERMAGRDARPAYLDAADRRAKGRKFRDAQFLRGPSRRSWKCLPPVEDQRHLRPGRAPTPSIQQSRRERESISPASGTKIPSRESYKQTWAGRGACGRSTEQMWVADP